MKIMAGFKILYTEIQIKNLIQSIFYMSALICMNEDDK